MGNSEELENLEKRVQDKIRLTQIQTALVATVATAGVIAITALAPNLFQILKFSGLDKKLKQRKQSSITRARGRLIDRGILEKVQTSKGEALVLTKQGKQLYERIEFSRIVIKKQKRWDKKWRMLVFDIVENKKGDRDELRRMLKKMGFLMLQDSVYLYPYPCDEYVALLKANFHIGKNLLYTIVEQIENDNHFRIHFGLMK